MVEQKLNYENLINSARGLVRHDRLDSQIKNALLKGGVKLTKKSYTKIKEFTFSAGSKGSTLEMLNTTESPKQGYNDFDDQEISKKTLMLVEKLVIGTTADIDKGKQLEVDFNYKLENINKNILHSEFYLSKDDKKVFSTNVKSLLPFGNNEELGFHLGTEIPFFSGDKIQAKFKLPESVKPSTKVVYIEVTFDGWEVVPV